jgi:hypothetical protein
MKQTKKYDKEDLAQKSNAYLKTKLFMAQRIAQQQKEIESLKEQLVDMTLKHSEMFDMVRSINEQLNSKDETVKPLMLLGSEDNINLSQSFTDSVVFEQQQTPQVSPKEQSPRMSQKDDKITQLLKNENLDLNKKITFFKTKEKEDSLMINKLIYEKYILFSELNELITCLKKVDNNLLNDFYLKNSEPSKRDSVSSMGIKYNILSAHSQLLLLDQKSDEKTQISLTENNKNIELLKQIPECKYVNLEKHVAVIKQYEEELTSKAFENMMFSNAAESAAKNLRVED